MSFVNKNHYSSAKPAEKMRKNCHDQQRDAKPPVIAKRARGFVTVSATEQPQPLSLLWRPALPTSGDSGCPHRASPPRLPVEIKQQVFMEDVWRHTAPKPDYLTDEYKCHRCYSTRPSNA